MLQEIRCVKDIRTHLISENDALRLENEQLKAEKNEACGMVREVVKKFTDEELADMAARFTKEDAVGGASGPPSKKRKMY